MKHLLRPLQKPGSTNVVLATVELVFFVSCNQYHSGFSIYGHLSTTDIFVVLSDQINVKATSIQQIPPLYTTDNYYSDLNGVRKMEAPL